MAANIKFIQFNMGRGRAAADLLNNKILEENIDWGILQEPYHKYVPPPGYRCLRNTERSKVCMVHRSTISRITIIGEISTDNLLIVKWEGGTKTKTSW